MNGVLCEWYAACLNEAAGTVAHPILPDVPTCASCAAKHDLDLIPFPAPTAAEEAP